MRFRPRSNHIWLERYAWKKKLSRQAYRRHLPINLGEVYEDCAYHPVYCTEADKWDVAGISLFDGSGPRSCSIRHCAPRLMSKKEVILRVKYREDWLKAQAKFKLDWSVDHYARLFQRENEEKNK